MLRSPAYSIDGVEGAQWIHACKIKVGVLQFFNSSLLFLPLEIYSYYGYYCQYSSKYNHAAHAKLNIRHLVSIKDGVLSS